MRRSPANLTGMRAVICDEYGPPSSLKLLEMDVPTPEPGEVLVRVAAVGINFPDTLIIDASGMMGDVLDEQIEQHHCISPTR